MAKDSTMLRNVKKQAEQAASQFQMKDNQVSNFSNAEQAESAEISDSVPVVSIPEQDEPVNTEEIVLIKEAEASEQKDTVSTNKEEPIFKKRGRKPKVKAEEERSVAFMLPIALIRKLDLISAWDGMDKKEVLKLAIESYVKKWETKNGSLQLIK